MERSNGWMGPSLSQSRKRPGTDYGPTARKNRAAFVRDKPGITPFVPTSEMFVKGPQLTFGNRLDFC